MTPIEVFLANDSTTLALGTVLVLGVFVFGWFEHRRTSRLPNLGTVMVKNRLKGTP